MTVVQELQMMINLGIKEVALEVDSLTIVEALMSKEPIISLGEIIDS